jgi:hypothetical protein
MYVRYRYDTHIINEELDHIQVPYKIAKISSDFQVKKAGSGLGPECVPVSGAQTWPKQIGLTEPDPKVHTPQRQKIK